MDWLLSGSSLGLWVPSFIEPQEMNLLINPAHHQYSAVKLIVERRPFKFNPRLFWRLFSEASRQIERFQNMKDDDPPRESWRLFGLRQR